jgi:hypothetical protein
MKQINAFLPRLFVVSVLCAVIADPAFSQQAISRNGSCTSGYNISGNYCVATNGHLHAIERNGSCPSGYNTSGNYCVRNGEGNQAIHRNGSCPSGYNTSGQYCVQSR